MIVEYVGTNYGQTISNELQNKLTVVLPEPVHTAAILARHAKRSAMIETAQKNMQDAQEEQRTDLQTEVTACVKEAKMKLVILKNAIAETKYQMTLDIPIELTDSEKTSNSKKSYRE
jgi:predicted metal-dependent hydrolase